MKTGWIENKETLTFKIELSTNCRRLILKLIKLITFTEFQVESLYLFSSCQHILNYIIKKGTSKVKLLILLSALQ